MNTRLSSPPIHSTQILHMPFASEFFQNPDVRLSTSCSAETHSSMVPCWQEPISQSAPDVPQCDLRCGNDGIRVLHQLPDVSASFPSGSCLSRNPTAGENGSGSIERHGPTSEHLDISKKTPKPLNNRRSQRPRKRRVDIRAMVKPLKRWLVRHKCHPYPSRQEKLLLCAETQMNMAQVSTWFANARRRLKQAVPSSTTTTSSRDEPEVSWQDRVLLYNKCVGQGAELLSMASSCSGDEDAECDDVAEDVAEDAAYYQRVGSSTDVQDVAFSSDVTSQPSGINDCAQKYKRMMLLRYLRDSQRFGAEAPPSKSISLLASEMKAKTFPRESNKSQLKSTTNLSGEYRLYDDSSSIPACLSDEINPSRHNHRKEYPFGKDQPLPADKPLHFEQSSKISGPGDVTGHNHSFEQLVAFCRGHLSNNIKCQHPDKSKDTFS